MSMSINQNGLSQLIEDEDTPVTMLGAMKALEQFTTSSAEYTTLQPARKRQKFQEYFEYYDVKREPVDHVQL